jgi:hypothetical protein
MNSKRIALGIGIVLLVLAVFTAHAAAHRAYFVPQHSSATTGNTTTMDVYVEIDAGENLGGGQLQIQFDPTHAKVTENYALCQYVNPTGPDQYCWESFNTNFDSERNGSMWGGVSKPQVSDYYDPPGPDPMGWYWVGTDDGLFHGPITVPVGTYVIEASGTPGVSPFNFGFAHFPEYCPACQKSLFSNGDGQELSITWENGTFTHEGEIPSQTFTKSLPLGWNLISLPLTPSDNSVSTVLSGVSQDAVMQYDATTKTFADATTMDPGIGYFVDVTSASTWEYEGTPVSSTSPGLKSGLNMIGVPNCTMSVSDAMGPAADYRYVARWNADDQKYEVYNPSAPSAFHHFTTMTAGEGYFISAGSDDDTFVVSCP